MGVSIASASKASRKHQSVIAHRRHQKHHHRISIASLHRRKGMASKSIVAQHHHRASRIIA
jgi:hypothetical protein